MDSDGRKAQFLIVENDANDAFFIKRALLDAKQCGSPVVCRNPSEARAYLKGAGMYADRDRFPDPDVILTDINMGTESGLGLVEWIRAQEPPLCGKKVIILSGSASPFQMVAASKVGAERIYSKPSKPEEFQKLLASIVTEFCKKCPD